MATKTKKAKATKKETKPWKPFEWPTKLDMEKGLRVALNEWWHDTRHALETIRRQAEQMINEVTSKPDGPLHSLIAASQLRSLEDGIRNATELLTEIVIPNGYYPSAPSVRMYDTASDLGLVPSPPPEEE